MPIQNKENKKKAELPKDLDKILRDEVIPSLEASHRKMGETTKFAIFDGSKIDLSKWTTNKYLKIAKELSGNSIVVLLMIKKEMKQDKKFSLHDQTNVMIDIISDSLNELTLIGLTDTTDFISYTLSDKGEKVVEEMQKDQGFTGLIIPMAREAYHGSFLKRLS